MTDSILQSVKKTLGIPADAVGFDSDILMYINTALSTLTQLGVGPAEGFVVEDEEVTWATLLNNDPRLNQVKTYVCLRARVLFDPPNTSYVLDAMKSQIDELAWRINVQREEVTWTDPTVPVTP